MEKIIMPKAGMAMESGTIIQWLKSVGDYVEFGEPLLEIETDKTSMTVEALASGYLLEKLYDNGDEVPVVTTIGWLGEKGEKPPASSQSSPFPSADSRREEVRSYDFVVLGGGPAGYEGAILAARAGKKTALVEEASLGGTCLNRGCIPTKTYLHTADILTSLPELTQRGITINNPAFTVDMSRAVAQKDQVVGKLVRGLETLMRTNGIDVYAQRGTIGRDHTVSLADGTRLQAGTVLFAGGSEAARIPVEGINLPGVLTSDELLNIESIPENLVVIGGGVIGVELGSAFAAFGSNITILEAMPRILPNMDPEITDVLRKKLEERGIRIETGVSVARIAAQGQKLQVELADGSRKEGDKVLLSIGRRPNLSGLGDSGVKTDDHGRVIVDSTMKTNVDWIYAPGDINGLCMLAHAASYMAQVAVEAALGEHRTYSGKHIPSCIYTKPEVACAGISEEEARKTSRPVAVGRFPFAANGRALASDEGVGLVKTVVDTQSGEILGVQIVGPDAAEMIADAVILMTMEITAYELEDIVWAHPTFGEALKQSLLDALGKSTDLPPRKE